MRRLVRAGLAAWLACLLLVAGISGAAAQDLAAKTPVSHQVTPSGSLSAQIPLPNVPGAGSLEPRLYLTYTSQGDNTGFGLGWSLQGYLSVARGNKSRSVDGAPGGIGFDQSDAFYLSGERLVPVSTTVYGGRNAIVYRKEIDDATVVYGFTTPGGDIGSFLVETKAGAFTVLDVTVRGGLPAPVIFLPSKTYDTAGNYILWSFRVSGLAHELDQVTYTGRDGASPIAPFAKIEFEYENLATPLSSYLLGEPLVRGRRLKSVSSDLISAAGPDPALKLSVTYRDVANGHRFYLEKAQLSAFGKTTPAVTFDHQDPGTQWTEVPNLQLPIPLAGETQTNEAYRLGAVRQAGPPPRDQAMLLFAAQSKGQLVARTYVARSAGWSEDPARASPVAFVDELGAPTGVVLIDLDGDGTSDLVQGASGGGRAWLAVPKGWKEEARYAPNLSFIDPATGKLLASEVLDLDGDQRLDLLLTNASGARVALLNKSAGWQRSSSHEFTTDRDQLYVDANCDGVTDRVEAYVQSGAFVLDLYTGGSGGWVKRNETQWLYSKPAQPGSYAAAIRARAAACGALLVSSGAIRGETLTLLQGRTTGWLEASASTPSNPFFNSAGEPLFPQFVDVNGDGGDDILVSTAAPAGTSSFAWLQGARTGEADPLSWATAPTTLTPPILLAGTERHPEVLLQDVDKDADVDIVALPSARDSAGRVFLAQQGQWQAAAAFSPAVQLAQTKDNSGFVRFVDLDADGLQDLVFNDGANEKGARFNTGAGWSTDDRWTPPRPLQRTGDVAEPGTFVDVNSDGYPDLVYAYKDSSGASVRETYLNPLPSGGAGWGSPVAGWASPTDFAAAKGGDLGARLGDVDADGRVDIVVAVLNRDSSLTTHVYLNTGSGWSETNDFKPTAAFTFEPGGGLSRLDLGTQLMDVNGDRLPDLVAAYRHPITATERKGVFLNSGRAFANTSTVQPPVMLDSMYYDGSSPAFMDVNGDAIADIVRFTKSAAEVYLGNGRTWTAVTAWNFPAEVRSSTHGFGATRFLDLNGDSLMDIAYHWPATSGDHKGNYLNTGSGWARGPAALDPAMPLIAENGTDAGVRQADVNGDGAVDLVRASRTSDGQLERSAQLSPGRRAGMVTDVNDGVGIASHYAYTPLTAPRGGAPAVFAKAAPTQYPMVPLTPFSPVVEASTIDEGAGRQRRFRYAYMGFRLDIREGRALGFERTEVIDEAAGIARRTEHEQREGLIGRPRLEEVTVMTPAPSQVVNRTTKAWTSPRVAGSPVFGRTYSFLQPRLDSSVVRETDLGGKLLVETTTSFTYDAWLNTKTSTIAVTGGATKSAVNIYGTTERFARFGRLTEAAVTTSKAGSPNLTKKTLFDYDPNTLLLRQEALDVGVPALGFTKTYGRDERGNVTSLSHSTPSAPTRVSSITYDTAGRYVVSDRNALNQTATRTYSSVIGTTFGAPSDQADVGGRSTRFDYDPMGRVVSMRQPDLTVKTVERLLPSALRNEWVVGLDHTGAVRPKSCHGATLPDPGWSPPSLGLSEAAYLTAADGSKRLLSVSINDSAGRLIRTVTPRTDGASARLAFVDREYDLLGRLIGRSHPYFSGKPSRWSRYVYDALNRRTKEVRVDGACNEIVFDGLVQTRRDALGRRTVATMTSDGQPLEIRRADNTVTRFDYDAMGRPVRITRPGNLVSNFSYDAAGNRTATEDPNGGKVEYRFDGFGQMRGEKAAGQTQWADVTFDGLGRVTRMWRPDQVTTWTYDAPGAVGQLASMSSQTQNVAAPASYSEAYDYDPNGQLKRTTVSVTRAASSTNFVGSYTFDYDAFGQLTRIVYPKSGPQGDFVVSRLYDAATGQLRGVLDASAPAHKSLWRLVEADAEGRSLRTALGNGAFETRTYSPNSGRLWRLAVRGPTKRLWESSYDYDAIGNLEARDDLVQGRSESFDYDDNDRLIRVDDGSRVVTAVYDSVGRLASKSDVGRYHYGCGPGYGPHAVCRVTRSGVTTQNFRYDGFGNVLQTDDTRVDYTFDHHVARLTRLASDGTPSQKYSEYVYGPAGQRVLTEERGCADALCVVYRTKQTLHLGLYERIAVTRGSSSLVTDRFYIASDQGVFLSVDAIDRTAARGSEATGPTSGRMYRHQDQLGTAVLFTGDAAAVLSRPRFDAWGAIRGGIDPENDEAHGLEAAVTRGFTGHDHVPQFNLVHMNGRVYDPQLALFLSVDPLLTDPYSAADLNPYIYAAGNPLRMTDPTGFGFFDDVGSAIGGAIGGIGGAIGGAIGGVGGAIGGAITDIWNGAGDLIHSSGQWIGQNWREIVTVAVVITVTVVAGPAGPVVAAMAAGAAGGATMTALYGGNLHDVMAAAIVGGVVGGMTGGITASGMNPWLAAGTQGFVSGTQSAAMGGSFEKGFLIGAISRGVNADRLVQGDSGWHVAGRIAVRSAANGSISELQGGKFANGAMSGAFEQLYVDAQAGQWRIRSVIQVIGAYQAREATFIGLGAGTAVWLAGYAQAPTFNEGVIQFQLNNRNAGGITFGNAVMYNGDADVLAHEYRHVAQYGSRGGREFFRQYSDQLTRFGYADAPFEAEAYRVQDAYAH